MEQEWVPGEMEIGAVWMAPAVKKSGCILTMEMRLWKSEFQYMGVNDAKSAKPTSDVWTIDIDLYLYL